MENANTSMPLLQKYNSQLLRKNNTLDTMFHVGLDNSVNVPYNGTMMIEKGSEMTEFEKNCFGMTEQDIREQYMDSLTARLSGLEMVVMGVLSDCQEMIQDRNETVRKQLNVAKFILSEMMDARMKESA